MVIDAQGGDVVHVAGNTHLRWQHGCGEQALDVFSERRVRVGDRGCLERSLGEAGRLRDLMPEAGVGEEAGSALGVVDHRDFEECGRGAFFAEQQLGEKGQVGDVVDDGLVGAASNVADNGHVAELEPEDDRGVDPVVRGEEPGLFATAFALPQQHAYSASEGTAGQGLTPLGHFRATLDELVDADVLQRRRRDGIEYPIWSTVHRLAVLTGQGPLRNLPDATRHHLEKLIGTFIEQALA